ncbi:MAG: hypothetical protein PHF44_03805 [Candidatus Pacebacteria bacterium]|nr:hypothetical protein [Candidatus Paceibacterota bacterium]
MLKNRIILTMGFINKKLSGTAEWISSKENWLLIFALIAFTAIPFLFIKQFDEVLTLIAPMYINGLGGIALCLANGKSVLETTIICACVWNIFVILFYLGIDLTKIISLKIKQWFFSRKLLKTSQSENGFWKRLQKKLKKIQKDFNKKERRFMQKTIARLSRLGTILTYLLWIIPFVPYLNWAIILLVKARKEKIGIWILLGLSFINVLLTVLLIQNGFQIGK